MNLLSFILLVLEIIGMYKVFEKLGEEGWKAIIPYYNTFTTLKIGRKNPWTLLLRIAGDISLLFAMFIFMVAMSMDGDVVGFIAIFALLFLIASIALYIVYVVKAFQAYANISEQLGQSSGYAWLFLFFPWVMWIIAGFDEKWAPDEGTIAYMNQQQTDKKNQHGAKNADVHGNQRPMDAQYNQRPAQPSQPRPPVQPAQQTQNQQQATMNVQPVTVKPVEPINIQPVTVKPVEMPDDSTKNTADNKTDDTSTDK